MSNLINPHRRWLLSGTSVLAGLLLFDWADPARADQPLPPASSPPLATPLMSPSSAPAASAGPLQPSFGTLRQIEAGTLNIGYIECGPAGGPVVILLHGWPHDVHSFAEVAPMLAAAGYRVIVPYLRGYGSTRFLSADTPRNGQQSIFAIDLIALMDALKIDRAVLAGFDWGGRAAEIVAAIWPQRCRALVCASGYLIGSQAAGRVPLAPETELQAWFQYYFATERGARGYAEHRDAFNRMVWQHASPRFQFDDATFLRTARAFDNPDHVAIVVHNYRWRLASPRARRGTTIWNNGSRRRPASPCRPSPSKATPTEHRTSLPLPMQSGSPASTGIGISRAGWVITCRRKRPRRLRRPCSTW